MVYEKIGIFSYVTFILHILIGTNLIVGISNGLEQDSWMGAVIGTLIALILFTIYYLMYYFGGKGTFSEIHMKAYGNQLGRAVTFLFGSYFLFMSAIMIANVAFFVQIILLPYTPFYMIIIHMCMLLGYMLFLRFGAFARASILNFFIITLVCIFLAIMAYFNGIVYIERMQPFISHTPKEIFTHVFPSVVTIPFGELLLLLVFLPMVSTQKSLYIKSMLVIVISGCILVFMMLVTTGILGGPLMDEMNFPILKATEKITLLKFIKRLDIITLTFFVLGAFMKMGLFLFGSFFMFKESIPKLKEDYIIFGMIAILVLGLLFMIPFVPYVELQNFLKTKLPYFFGFPFTYFLPIFTFILIFLKRKKV